ncbi:SDR family NAD(P)-dependent oxidoreductase [Photobacterium damselae subsp. damselae]|uniref:SDR family NAD(P)-dependent oxidoreductase n=1 Tax=Photobacterium damselae TaxID=38293 RepID=UPI00083B01ED|nr:SDR family NAD(P)-dependent oxidoreductase [Photobacterium damselae]ODA23442.1 short-chain dehydrogenase [Photobacterium damselae subsp. damselae]UKA06942.1 SDR family NAD(P)-dependent oxidoreductase [Photobacterium damselae subsp. damselae]UKA22048.1 SDR family NAD(P)-dependent oxidoreductase [Photobacterium damselae subsp. damselae]
MLSILITGCSSGIGFYCAKQLHQAGHHVVATCRTEYDHKALQQLGISTINMEMSDDTSIEKGFAQALALLNGNIDILFNNAAYGQPGALEDLPTEALKEQFATNFFGWHTLTRLTISQMLKQKSGKIVQNSSVLGLVAMKYRGAYNASKFAIEGYTDTLRLELADTPIHISLIEPGPIESQFRATAKRYFERYINIEHSRHKHSYQQTLERLANPSPSNRFTLQPDAVYQRLLSIIEAKQPKARYFVTQPTYIFAFLRRVLPSQLLDKIVSKSH